MQDMLSDVTTASRLVPRSAVGSVEELIRGATAREPFAQDDGKSGSQLERVRMDGVWFVLKHLHPDADWTMRGFGDLCCRPVRLWTSGLLDAMPAPIDHAVVAAAHGIGRNGWGGALLLEDRSDSMVPPGDDPVSLETHRHLLMQLAELAAAFWGCDDLGPGLLPLSSRYTAFNPSWLVSEADLGWPEPVPKLAQDGWRRFAGRCPPGLHATITELRRDIDPLVTALASTPWTFLHGDWKLGNLGITPEGRTVLLDWTYPGIGPVLHELGWYLALNRARLPESKEETIAALRGCLDRSGVDTDGWWDRQLDLCLLGTLVQFGWEKALGDDDELVWWCERATAGAARL